MQKQQRAEYYVINSHNYITHYSPVGSNYIQNEKNKGKKIQPVLDIAQ